jgi:hypothetical protein
MYIFENIFCQKSAIEMLQHLLIKVTPWWHLILFWVSIHISQVYTFYSFQYEYIFQFLKILINRKILNIDHGERFHQYKKRVSQLKSFKPKTPNNITYADRNASAAFHLVHKCLPLDKCAKKFQYINLPQHSSK